MPLAGEQDRVALPCQLERERDRLAAVATAVVGLPLHARFQLLEDPPRVFGARVVGGHDGDVGEPGGDLAHGSALATIAVAAPAAYEDDPSRGQGPHALERALHRRPL